MKIFEKILSAAFVVMLITTVGAGALLANNHGDSSYTFVFPNNYDYQYTSGRYKMDDSDCYLKTTTSGANFQIHAEGITKEANSWANCSNGYYYTATYNQEVFLHNWVWEWGKKYTSNEYRKARIAAHRLSGTYTVTGVWSPDSV